MKPYHQNKQSYNIQQRHAGTNPPPKHTTTVPDSAPSTERITYSLQYLAGF